MFQAIYDFSRQGGKKCPRTHSPHVKVERERAGFYPTNTVLGLLDHDRSVLHLPCTRLRLLACSKTHTLLTQNNGCQLMVGAPTYLCGSMATSSCPLIEGEGNPSLGASQAISLPGLFPEPLMSNLFLVGSIPQSIVFPFVDTCSKLKVQFIGLRKYSHSEYSHLMDVFGLGNQTGKIGKE